MTMVNLGEDLTFQVYLRGGHHETDEHGREKLLGALDEGLKGCARVRHLPCCSCCQALATG